MATLKEKFSFFTITWIFACTGVVMGFWRIVITILLPPLGVLLGKGLGLAFLLNIVLTLLGYVPGLIHAFWVQSRN